jgi:hypothetical protein
MDDQFGKTNSIIAIVLLVIIVLAIIYLIYLILLPSKSQSSSFGSGPAIFEADNTMSPTYHVENLEPLYKKIILPSYK